ncbi:hypothetical protein L6452_09285 [Arctium lappa]|uniref:Uncharacterized protein n=1 Tax=Arctium lappa TaxID=4217 RepID=A0ACB9DJL0_ARCLA|nr:hypothetical protein L6452_09285 [Arctium lappa]
MALIALEYEASKQRSLAFLSTGVEETPSADTYNSACRHLMGEGLGCLNVKELKQTRLERGISRIRSKKEIELNTTTRSCVQRYKIQRHL